MPDDDESYYRRRAATEIYQVRSSPNELVAAVHRMLADAYLDRAARLAVDRTVISKAD